ncbi:hypothetical protein CY658_17975 [Variovorax sp. RO1]|uniref:DUF1120 domain-containing protein n=1 Tax=Variovorax sp. RO1 TaxID=2066034 RepID=UPI000C718620|nr:DUF1120 domain-containing protein [Variovorax sp. RO1]PLC03931.1 hypothetical protein CY658_17975 [Variovorax sp. RO1]
MKKIATLAAVAGVAAVMMAPLHASAERSELRITGAIVPSACTLAFAGGGVVDYGTIFASSLNQTGQTTLADKSTQLTLTCEAPALFAFKVIDEHAGTAVTSLTTVPAYDAKAKFGLGAVDGKNIGAYSFKIENETSDHGATRQIFSLNGGANWTLSAGGVAGDGSKLVAFTDSAAVNVPSPYTSVTADIRLVTAIDKGSNLPLTQKIPLDGLSTFELVYL